MRIPVHNPSAMPIYVHGAMILPGETRHFDESDVPPHMRPVAEAVESASPDAPLLSLLDDSIKNVLPKLDDLQDADIARLLVLESDGQNRKTLIEELHKSLDERVIDAAVTALLSGDADSVIAALPDISDEEIERLIEIETDNAAREAVLTAASAETLKRKG